MVHRYESLFGFTVAGDRSSVMAATKIVELLEELGHEVLTRHLIREDAWQADHWHHAPELQAHTLFAF